LSVRNVAKGFTERIFIFIIGLVINIAPRKHPNQL